MKIARLAPTLMAAPLLNLTTVPGETTNLYFENPENVTDLKALLEASAADGCSGLPRCASPSL